MAEYDKYLSEVNKRSIELAIKEGLRPMLEFYDPNRDDPPYFGNIVSKGKDFGNMHHKSASISHIPGRWLNALLNAQDVLDVDLPANVIENLKKWTYRSLEEANIRFPAYIDFDKMVIEKSTDLHNLREVMHALYALSAFRNESKAYDLAIDIISAVNQYFDYDNCRFRENVYLADTGANANCEAGDPRDKEKFPFPVTFGRYIGPLVKLYNTTGSESALEQALRLQETCFTYILDEDGSYNPRLFGAHTHSTTSMVSSLAQLGDAVNDLNILVRVKRFLENGLKEIALDFGWCIENYYRKDFTGEINNTSDIMEACLILGKHGFDSYYARAERILRGHFLPSQLLDTQFIPEYNEPEEQRELPTRAKGAFGFPSPYGHEDSPGSLISFNWDIVGGAIGGLCEAYRHKSTRNGNLLSVNLLFDHNNKYLSFKSPYGRKNIASLTIKSPSTVRVRIPTNSTIELGKINGCNTFINNEWLYLTGIEPKSEASIPFKMQSYYKDYCFRDKLLFLKWEGEEVAGATSSDKRLCFFEELDLPQKTTVEDYTPLTGGWK